MDRILIRPVGNRKVRMPEGGFLPEEGMDVPRDLFWQRRLADGDVEIVPAKSGKPKGADA